MMECVATDLFRRAEIGWKIGYMERWNDWNDGIVATDLFRRAEIVWE